jgi:hypothetical protein
VIGDAKFCYRPPKHLAADSSVFDDGIPYLHSEMLPSHTNADNLQMGRRWGHDLCFQQFYCLNVQQYYVTLPGEVGLRWFMIRPTYEQQSDKSGTGERAG